MPTNLPVRSDMRDHGTYLALIPFLALLVLCFLQVGPMTIEEGANARLPPSGAVVSAVVMLR